MIKRLCSHAVLGAQCCSYCQVYHGCHLPPNACPSDTRNNFSETVLEILIYYIWFVLFMRERRLLWREYLSWIHVKNTPDYKRSEKGVESKDSLFLSVRVADLLTLWGSSCLKPPPVSQLIPQASMDFREGWLNLIERADRQQCCHARLGNLLFVRCNSLV